MPFNLSHCVFIIVLSALLPGNRVYAVEDIQFDGGFRYRYQSVEDPQRGDASASTLKLRVNSKLTVNDWIQGEAEIDHVYAFNDGHYNSVTVFRPTSPIPDPDGTELNKLFLSFSGWGNWQARIGRQPISFANERHVGSIDFWQKNQSFDAFRVSYDDTLNLRVDYAYLESVQRIFGRDARSMLPAQDPRAPYLPYRPAGELGIHEHDSHLINIDYRLNHLTNVSSYFYHLDNQSWWIFSSQTLGTRIETSFKPADLKYRFAFELASQRDAADNPWAYHTYYGLLEAEVQYKSHRVSVSAEYIGEDNGVPFATSLGTNHKFQGWADVFTDYLSNTGMTDYYLSYKGRKGKLRWRGVYHYFYDNDLHHSIGTELDLELAYRLTRKWEAKLVFAKYFATNGVSSNQASKQDLSTIFASIAYNI